MIKRFRVITRRPYFYGILYLALTPIYAAIYFFIPGIVGDDRSFIECLYFSTVTITTLGYGDITPLGQLGQLVSASEAILGIISIGLFLNAIASVRSDTVRAEQMEKEKRILVEDQRARLNGHYRLIEPIIRKYKLTVIEITHPATNPSEQYNSSFALNDMKDMYQPTRLLRAPRLRPAIIGYFEAMEDLHNEISDLTKRVDLRVFPDIERQCLQISRIILEFDYSGAIVSALHTRVGEENTAEYASKAIEEYEGDSLPLGKGNMLDGYILLYHQIKLVMECLSYLEAAVEKDVKPTV